MADITGMSEEELNELLIQLQEQRETWISENLLSGERNEVSDELQVIDPTFPDTTEGDNMEAAYSRRFNKALSNLKEDTQFDIPGYVSTEIYANVKDQREEVKKHIENNKEKVTVLDLTIGEIIKNTVMTIVNFQKVRII